MEKDNRRPILEWLNTLPEAHDRFGNIRAKALGLYDKSFKPISNEPRKEYASTLHDAIECAFHWGDIGTEEFDYWDLVYMDAVSGALFDRQSGTGAYDTEGITWEDESPWISVKDRLPDDGVEVPAFFPNGNESGQKRAGGIRSKNKIISSFPNSTAYCFEASHWFDIHSLPDPPKE